LGLTALAIALAWFGVVAPVLSWFDERNDLLQRQEALERRMASLVDRLPALRREATEAARSMPGDGHAGHLLEGSSDSLAAASLQQRIEALAAANGARLGTKEILPAKPDRDLRAISVRLTLSAPYRSTVALLLALANSDLPMVVDDLVIRKSPEVNESDSLPVEVSLTVMSWRPASVESQ
jgi:general secretion pathway protein M